ncbi:hypothetical protein [Legionella bozemanae]|nr:hypothetical protein [Legionella bozemanae]
MSRKCFHEQKQYLVQYTLESKQSLVNEVQPGVHHDKVSQLIKFTSCRAK